MWSWCLYCISMTQKEKLEPMGPAPYSHRLQMNHSVLLTWAGPGCNAFSRHLWSVWHTRKSTAAAVWAPAGRWPGSGWRGGHPPGTRRTGRFPDSSHPDNDEKEPQEQHGLSDMIQIWTFITLKGWMKAHHHLCENLLRITRDMTAQIFYILLLTLFWLTCVSRILTP